MNAAATSRSSLYFETPNIPLTGSQGDLLMVSIAVEPRDLESLLDTLGESRYPIDPQLNHDARIHGRSVTLVEFPAYESWLDEIHKLLENGKAVTIRKCFAQHPVPN